VMQIHGVLAENVAVPKLRCNTHLAKANGKVQKTPEFGPV
jgi:hypothetical protein